MKNINLKYSAIAYLLFFALFTGTVFAQNAYNLSGTFEGLRSQYNKERTAFSQEFQYKYELLQKGNIVEGISTIISKEGDYAEVGIRGIVIKDKLYFEEFKMLDQIKPISMVWCYKSGVLNISQKDNEIILSGNTASYMVDYGYACSGGFTSVSAFKESTETISNKNSFNEANISFNLFPNPTTEYINFNFNNDKRQFATVEIFDLTGKSLIGKTTRQIEKGNFTEKINIAKQGLSNGLYIFKLTLGDKIFSKEFIVAHN